MEPVMVMNRFEPECVLGTGTYGHVVKCNDRESNEKVAVKIAHPEPAYRRSAMNEIFVLQHLQHCDKVVRYHGYFEAEERIHIVCELLDKNLYEHLKATRFRPLPLDRIRDVAHAALEACAELHKIGFMHCDVKPENVMLRAAAKAASEAPAVVNMAEGSIVGSGAAKEPDVLMIDFGSVRRIAENQYYDIQSLWYRAPEVMCGLPYTPAIDSWSIGCLLYELRTGMPLFPGDDPCDAMERIVKCVGQPSARARTQGKLARNLNFDVTRPSSPSPLENATSGDSAQEKAFRELVFALLQPDETLRLSCEDALRTDFLTMTRESESISSMYAGGSREEPSMLTDSPVHSAIAAVEAAVPGSVAEEASSESSVTPRALSPPLAVEEWDVL